MKNSTYVIYPAKVGHVEFNKTKEYEMTDETQPTVEVPVVEKCEVPHPDTCILPNEWSEYTKAAWYDRQLDAYNKANGNSI